MAAFAIKCAMNALYFFITIYPGVAAWAAKAFTGAAPAFAAIEAAAVALLATWPIIAGLAFLAVFAGKIKSTHIAIVTAPA